MRTRIIDEIRQLYGDVLPEVDLVGIADRVEALIRARQIDLEVSVDFSESESVVIAYGDSVSTPGATPLACLRDFCRRRLGNAVSAMHILPFCPYTSDDGFSVVDYRKIDPKLGSWEDIRAIAREFHLMGDLVLNHCSSESAYVKGFLKDDPAYREFCIALPADTDVSQVARPRTSPLLTRFDGRYLWTTFSADQVDLNYANPEVLLEMTDILLGYLERGIRIIRMDAIAYLWKELGTPCIHHPKTHAAVRFFRAVMDAAAPGSVLITETNVPHRENLSYLGDGTSEAHMVYQFPLPPLVLDAFLRGDSSHLRAWVATLPAPGAKSTYFNFLASHDGIGVLPTDGILSPEELENLIAEVKKRGGAVSYKTTASGEIPYELNINYLSAIAEKNLPATMRARKFLASQAVLLAMPGIPGIYIHSLLGSENWDEGPGLTGMKRSINRERLSLSALERELDDAGSLRAQVFEGYLRMLETRKKLTAFHPLGTFEIPDAPKELFAIRRHSPDGRAKLTAVINTSGETLRAPWSHLGFKSGAPMKDLLSGRELGADRDIHPWEVFWIRN